MSAAATSAGSQVPIDTAASMGPDERSAIRQGSSRPKPHASHAALTPKNAGRKRGSGSHATGAARRSAGTG